LSDSGDAYKK